MDYQQYQYNSSTYTSTGSEQQLYRDSPHPTLVADFPPGPPPPSPWDATPTLHAFDDAQFAAAMAATAAYAQQESLLPPIATLEMVEAHARDGLLERSTPTATTATATPTPTPNAIATETAVQETQTRSHEYEYRVPQVIQLSERPLQRRTRARARQKAAQTQAQAQGQQREEARAQHQVQAQAQAQARTTSNLSSPVTNSPVEQQQLTAQIRGSALVTSVPSPGQWYDMHALAASHARTNTKINNEQQLQSQTARGMARQAAHPYLRQRRTVSGPAVMSSTHRQRDMSAPTHIPSSSTSTSLPASSPVASTALGSTPTPTPAPVSGPRYLVRTDVHYDLLTNTLTAMLELPGVPRAAVRVALGDDARSGARVLIVRGRMRRIAFPPTVHNPGSADGGGEKGKGKEKEGQNREGAYEEEGYLVRERKCGEFKRVLVVPPETTPDHIQVSMANGILFLRYPAGEQSVSFIQAGVGAAATPNPTPVQAQAQAQVRTQFAGPTQSPNPEPPQTQAGSPSANQGGLQINFRGESGASNASSIPESTNDYSQNYLQNRTQRVEVATACQ